MMKFIRCIAVILSTLVFSTTAYALETPSIIINPELTDIEIREGLTTLAPIATNHVITYAEHYGINGLQNEKQLYYGSPFYMFNFDADTEDIALNKSTIYYPLILDEKVISILIIAKAENGELFCNIGYDFADIINDNLGVDFVLLGNGDKMIALNVNDINNEMRSGEYLSKKMITSVHANVEEGVLRRECLLTENSMSEEVLKQAFSLENNSRISSTGGRLTNFPTVVQSTKNTCVSACILATARYLEPSKFNSWTDKEIHRLTGVSVDKGLTLVQARDLLTNVLNNYGSGNYSADSWRGRMTTNEIIKTLYNNELPALCAYGTIDRDGHFVTLCGFSKTSTLFSAEFMDPGSGIFRYSTAADDQYALVIKGVTYRWKETISID